MALQQSCLQGGFIFKPLLLHVTLLRTSPCFACDRTLHVTLQWHPAVPAATVYLSLALFPWASWQAQDRDLASLLVLMVHAGGDSKRVPWANPIGKPFIPFPLLAGDDPEGPSLTLFDHILAVSALARTAFNAQG